MDEHTFLIAFTVEGEDRSEARANLAAFLPERPSGHVDSWWEAEDDRGDRSDCDSAVFVNPGNQRKASQLLAFFRLTQRHNIVPEGRNTNGFTGKPV